MSNPISSANSVLLQGPTENDHFIFNKVMALTKEYNFRQAREAAKQISDVDMRYQAEKFIATVVNNFSTIEGRFPFG